MAAITREYIEQMLTEITAARDKAQADMVANNGAIQLLKHMLASFDRAESDAKTDAVVAGYKATHDPAPKGKAKANGGAPKELAGPK